MCNSMMSASSASLDEVAETDSVTSCVVSIINHAYCLVDSLAALMCDLLLPPHIQLYKRIVSDITDRQTDRHREVHTRTASAMVSTLDDVMLTGTTRC